MLLSSDEEPEEPHLQQKPKSLRQLGESIQCLLGFKEDLTFRWAESVLLIIEDLSSSQSCDSGSHSPRSILEPFSRHNKQQLLEDVAKLEIELSKLRELLKKEDGERMDFLNRYLDLKGNVRVFCRVRPFVGREQQSSLSPIVVAGSDNLIVKSGGKRRTFQVDKVFQPAASQDDVFAELSPLVRSALDGHNVCIFAYGQTGAGKTFTMEGTKECPGVVPRTLQLLFHLASQDNTRNYVFTFSMLELYLGNLRDLLVRPPMRITDPAPKCLLIKTDVRGGVEVENLTEYIIQDAHEAGQLYNIGSHTRATACTNSNDASSRSHCLVRITAFSTNQLDECPSLSKLWLIDLGGSERLLKTDAKGWVMEEGKAINLSLSALGDVISALQKKQSHIPYRNSKLTQILRDSLSEHSKTVMLIHVNPKEDDVGETICTLGFATRARGIHLGKELSMHEKEHRARVMDELLQKLLEYENRCQHTRGNIQELEYLCRKKKEMLEGEGHDHESLQNGSLMTSVSAKKPECRASGILIDSISASIPRFMMATASSRLKGHADIADKMKRFATEKKAGKHVRRRLSYGIQNGASKILPMEATRESDNGNGSSHNYMGKCTIAVKQRTRLNIC